MRKPASEKGVIKTLIGFLLTMLAFFVAYVAMVFIMLYSKD